MENSLKLENQICFKIYSAERKITKLYRELLEELNVTYPQYLVLLVLWETSEISVKDLGGKLLLDSGTLTPMLKRMEANGLIVRNRSKQDERSVIISLTHNGVELKKKAECIPSKLISNLSMDVKKLKEFDNALTELLKKI
jgi:DNA-binding MarR family transcriptional regulator